MSYFDELWKIVKAQEKALAAARAAQMLDLCLPELKTDNVYMTRSAQRRFIKKVFGFLPSNWMENGILSEALFKRTQHCTGKVIKPRVRYKLTRQVEWDSYGGRHVYK